MAERVGTSTWRSERGVYLGGPSEQDVISYIFLFLELVWNVNRRRLRKLTSCDMKMEGVAVAIVGNRIENGQKSVPHRGKSPICRNAGEGKKEWEILEIGDLRKIQ